MGHWAKVFDNKVFKVVVAEEDFIKSYDDPEGGEWIQASYNTRGGIHYQPNTTIPSEDQSKALRKNYPGVGYTYDRERDAFIPPKPHLSWILDEDTCLWKPPVPKPVDEGIQKMYVWNEYSQEWDEISSRI